VKSRLSIVFFVMLSLSAIGQEKRKTKIPLFVSHLSVENAALTRRKGAPNHFFLTRLICFNERCRFFVGFRNEQRRNSFDNKKPSNRPRKRQTIQDTASLLLEKRTGNVQIPLVKQKTPGIKTDSTITLSEVLFEFNSYRLKQGMIPTLDSIAAFLRIESKASVNVLGHTDNSGKEDYNLTLSSQRAEVVAEFLLDRGVDPERVSSNGKGSSQPILPNNTPEGRRKNRRVEILIRWKN